MAKVLCIGDSCADIMIPYGEALNGKSTAASFSCGGSTANTAVALAKLGVPVSFIGRVGRDVYGLKMKEEFEKYGVDTKGLIVDENSVSTQILVVVDEKGERFPFLMPKDNPSYLNINPEDLFLDDEVVYILTNGMMLFDEPAASSIADFLFEAKEHGARIILDLNFRVETKDRDRKYLDKVVSICNVLLGSVEDFKIYTGCKCPQNAVLKMLKPNFLVCAHDEKGSAVATTCCQFYTKSYKVDVVDTIGAGDAFNAGFIYGLINKVPLSKCNLYGCLLGAYCVSGKGARHTPDIIELMNFSALNE